MNFIHNEDTIAAISTPYGYGGIAIVRVSGKNAFIVAERIYKGKQSIYTMASHTVQLGFVYDLKGEKLDQVLLLKLKGPGSFTGEDTVEFSCHGGIIPAREMLGLLISSGARPAGPGEFTKRAFLNGKLDLSQAEAVADIICSKTKEGAKQALRQLEGGLSAIVDRISDSLLVLLAKIEVSIDYPEHDEEWKTAEELSGELKIIIREIDKLLDSFERGRTIRDGINIVIAGKPNAGKSSLMNILSGRDRSIVTHIPGTTRDVVEDTVNIRGIPAIIKDTAGVRKTNDFVENAGVEKTLKEIETSHLVLVVFDAASPFDENDENIINSTENSRRFFIINKQDLSPEGVNYYRILLSEYPNCGCIEVSAKTHKGIDNITKSIAGLFDNNNSIHENEICLANERHFFAVSKAGEFLNMALNSLLEGYPVDICANDVRSCVEELGKITGRTVSEELTREIFSKFCIGK